VLWSCHCWRRDDPLEMFWKRACVRVLGRAQAVTASAMLCIAPSRARMSIRDAVIRGRMFRHAYRHTGPMAKGWNQARRRRQAELVRQRIADGKMAQPEHGRKAPRRAGAGARKKARDRAREGGASEADIRLLRRLKEGPEERKAAAK
jgi:hypothetical protein